MVSLSIQLQSGSRYATSGQKLDRSSYRLLQEFASSGLEHALIVIFGLLRGLAVARVLARAERPGVGLGGALPPRAVPDAAQEVLDGHPHLLVLVGVDAGVHDGVEHGQEEQPAL